MPTIDRPRPQLELRQPGAHDRAVVLGCAIDRLDMAGTVERCREAIEQRRYTQHVSINASKLVALRQQASLREIICSCQLINADGQSVVWASRLLGDPLPERVAGIDLMQELFALAEARGYRIFILGARAEVLETAVGKLREQHPRLAIAGFHHGYFSDDESPRVAAEIRAAQADILFVAMTSPRKEQWLGQYGPTLEAPLVMGVGGSIDVVAGVTRRAPGPWQRAGLEWMYRLLQEPRRLAGRYIRTNMQFIGLVIKDLALRGRRRPD
ncbi:MAG TPA: WecB/TagA/CpsF family glycosyltransferase [Solirubrobacteraceae bacterium]|nr:WecB/TagA/CpsF family glycosyltransferase [Solirubrobacteraceae bacterium]